MGLFGKSDPSSQNKEDRQIEKIVAKEERDEQKNLDHTVKDLSSAEKAYNKTVKAISKAQHQLERAVEKEHNASKAVNRAAHNHDAAIANEQNAEKTVELHKEHEVKLGQDLEQKRRQLEDAQQRKAHNDT
ncbi:hypothetical protein BN946_scf184632.g9 [Trametes cinnabarina]|uniref:Uncharacterized protein n=1 Tax=Pycnoporus cinnabarinus TaxID=5643 RepID=A0A060SJ68_PYCCI|nr:hypothetical protein BN946_scf184632.g9 [Trametes cinnabarina]